MSTSGSNTHQSLLQNDTIASVSMGCCGKSFYIINSNSFSAPQCWSALGCIFDIFRALRPIYDNPNAYQSGVFSVIFTSASQLNYLFT